jgi:hypothetical protein
MNLSHILHDKNPIIPDRRRWKKSRAKRKITSESPQELFSCLAKFWLLAGDNDDDRNLFSVARDPHAH